jgi:DNA-binding NarL/FixJ family response regulator
VSQIAIVVSDLLFQSRIAAAVARLGHEATVADSAATVAAALAARPALAIIDLHERNLDALAAVRSAKAAGARVLAFGRHTEPLTLRAARDAGADLVVPRSQLSQELPQLIESLLSAQEPAAASD